MSKLFEEMAQGTAEARAFDLAEHCGQKRRRRRDESGEVVSLDAVSAIPSGQR
jgi:hypothetical protein